MYGKDELAGILVLLHPRWPCSRRASFCEHDVCSTAPSPSTLVISVFQTCVLSRGQTEACLNTCMTAVGTCLQPAKALVQAGQQTHGHSCWQRDPYRPHWSVHWVPGDSCQVEVAKPQKAAGLEARPMLRGHAPDCHHRRDEYRYLHAQCAHLSICGLQSECGPSQDGLCIDTGNGAGVSRSRESSTQGALQELSLTEVVIGCSVFTPAIQILATI